MDTYQHVIATLALTMGSAWASGINLYATLLMLGLGASHGGIVLPPELAVLQNPLVIGAAGFMYAVEFFADKTPGVDSAWDALHTFVRIPAGAMLAAAAVGEVQPSMELAAAILGGSLATVSHATKAGGRLVINTSPEPLSNMLVSVCEDVAVLAGLWTALHHPLLFLGLLGLFLLMAAWLLPRIVRVLRRAGSWLLRRLGLASRPPETSITTETSQEHLRHLDDLRQRGLLTPEAWEQEQHRLRQPPSPPQA
ncbi:MAG: DUF4126 domain-containing protein [Magnetococcus sp. WYHC-3]